MSSVPRHGSDVPPGGLVDARDRAGCLVVTGMLDREMDKAVKGELAPELRATVDDMMQRALGSCLGADHARPKP